VSLPAPDCSRCDDSTGMLARRDGRQLRFLCVAIEPAADPRELNGGVEAAGDEVGGRFGFEFVLGVRESGS